MISHKLWLPEAWGVKCLGVPDFEATGISKAILTILMKPCTITPQAIVLGWKSYSWSLENWT